MSPKTPPPESDYLTERCDICGELVDEEGAGVSGSQSWSYDRDGTPDLQDPTYRCSPCTDIHGVKPSNCHGSSEYAWRNPLTPEQEPSEDETE